MSLSVILYDNSNFGNAPIPKNRSAITTRTIVSKIRFASSILSLNNRCSDALLLLQAACAAPI